MAGETQECLLIFTDDEQYGLIHLLFCHAQQCTLPYTAAIQYYVTVSVSALWSWFRQ